MILLSPLYRERSSVRPWAWPREAYPPAIGVWCGAKYSLSLPSSPAYPTITYPVCIIWYQSRKLIHPDSKIGLSVNLLPLVLSFLVLFPTYAETHYCRTSPSSRSIWPNPSQPSPHMPSAQNPIAAHHPIPNQGTKHPPNPRATCPSLPNIQSNPIPQFILPTVHRNLATPKHQIRDPLPKP